MVLTVTQQPPFDSATDPACEPSPPPFFTSLIDKKSVGISFVAIFIVAYNIVFWVLGAAHSLSWDYLPSVPQGEAAERRVSWKEKPIGGWISRILLGKSPDIGSGSQVEKVMETADSDPQPAREANNNLGHRHADHDLSHTDPGTQLTAHESRVSITSFFSRRLSTSSLPTFGHQDAAPAACSSHLPLEINTSSSTTPPSKSSTALKISPDPHKTKSQISKFIPPFLARLIRQLTNIVNPITLTLLISLPIALIQPLKALFVDTSQAGGPNWKGPDGRPPLYFVIDTGKCLLDCEPADTIPPPVAAFLGGITVPMALILLGASFARLSVSRPLSRLPIPAMFAVSLAKMFLLPVIGIFWVQAMVKRGIIPKCVAL